jgi:hypothetical protein
MIIKHSSIFGFSKLTAQAECNRPAVAQRLGRLLDKTVMMIPFTLELTQTIDEDPIWGGSHGIDY